MAANLPSISSENFVPALPKMPPRELNWMGRTISWVRNSREHGLIHHIVVSALAIFLSLALIFSIVLSPLFLYGYREYIHQCERAIYDREYGELLKIATNHGSQSFHKGRLAPLLTAKVHLGWTNRTRRKIARDLQLRDSQLSDKEVAELSDRDLLLRAALFCDNVFERYNLKVC